jgi:sulfane dehydrogenase subunit SoxC
MAQDSQRDSDSSTPAKEKLTRRTLLATAAAGWGTAMIRGDAEAAAPAATSTGTSGDERWLVSDLGQRSPHEKPRRLVANVDPNSVSKTPLQDLDGIITPSDLHYERHHTGIPIIDPDQYTLRIEGLVERPMTFSLQALKKLPKHSVFRYME